MSLLKIVRIPDLASNNTLNHNKPSIKYDMIWYICLLQLGWHTVAEVQYTYTHKQYIEQQNRHEQYIEQHN